MAAGLTGAAQAEPAAGDLRLMFCGLAPKGQVVIALFDSEASWRARDHPVRAAKPQAAATCVEQDLPGLAPGRYAVMAFHDRNANSRLDMIPLGPPVEPYGFSNDARTLFGPPRWDQAAFEVRAGEVTMQRIRLH